MPEYLLASRDIEMTAARLHLHPSMVLAKKMQRVQRGYDVEIVLRNCESNCSVDPTNNLNILAEISQLRGMCHIVLYSQNGREEGDDEARKEFLKEIDAFLDHEFEDKPEDLSAFPTFEE